MEEQFENNQDPLWEHQDFQTEPHLQDWCFEPEKPRKNAVFPKVTVIVATALISSLIGGLLGAAGGLLFNGLLTPGSTGTTALIGDRHPTVSTAPVDTDALMTPAQVYAKSVNSTVGITTSITTNYWGFQSTSAASGSGFILTDDGYIMTNYHVIEGSSSITVSSYDGTAYEAALVGYDVSNDIAVLKIDAQGLTPAILGDSDRLNVGESVVAIGNPLGELTFSLTAGTISAKDRLITLRNGTTMNLLQTDCAINSGNSGGALFNLYGEVIGITNAKYSSSSAAEASIDNIGFAIPINDARQIAFSIIEKGYVEKPYIGISVSDVSVESQNYGLPQGAAVRTVAEDSPAAQAGILPNDIITQVNGQPITGSAQLIRFISDCQIGQSISVQVYRSGQTLQVGIVIGTQIQEFITN